MKPQILAIDCGNTNIKWALFAAATTAPRVLQSGAFATNSVREELALLVATVMHFATIANQLQTLKVMISNVAGSAVADAFKYAFSTHAASLHFVESQAVSCGMHNGYVPPHTLGVDRFAALVAAHKQPQNQLVVMAGTALTIDALNQTGQFLGGIIVPGLRTMQDALYQGTAQLPRVANDALICAFPTHTVAAIASGAMQACVGAVVMQALTHARALRTTHENVVRIVIAGGAATAMLPHLEIAVAAAFAAAFAAAGSAAAPVIVMQPNLVLEGLFYLAAATIAPTV